MAAKSADELMNSEPAAFATDKLSDRLFTKTSLRCITASSVRERERLIRLFKGIDRAIHSTNIEYNFYKKAIYRKQNLFQKKLLNPPIPRQGNPNKKSTTVAASAPTIYTYRSTVQSSAQIPETAVAWVAEQEKNISAPEDGTSGEKVEWKKEQLLKFIDEVEDDEKIQQSAKTHTKSRISNVSFEEDEEAFITSTKKPSARFRSRRISSIKTPKTATTKDTQGQSDKAKKDGFGLNSEDIRRLVMKLHGTELIPKDVSSMTDEEQRIYKFIKRHCVDLLDPSLQENEVLDVIKDTSADDTDANQNQASLPQKKFLENINNTPMLLPPIHRGRPTPLIIRQWDLDKPAQSKKSKATVSKMQPELWEELRYCRYLRAPQGMLREIGAEEQPV